MELKTDFITVFVDNQVIVYPTLPATIIYTDTQGNPTTIYFPAGTFTETTVIVYTPIETVTEFGGYRFAGHAFTLTAYMGGLAIENLEFKLPVTVTIVYSDFDVEGLDETTLFMIWWDPETDTRKEAACGNYGRYPDNNKIQLPVCHFSLLAVFAQRLEENWIIYLPLLESSDQ